MDSTLRAGQTLRLTVLSQSQPSFRCVLVEMCEPFLRLRLKSEVPCASPVKIEAEDLLLLGDVSYCELEPGGYAVGVAVRYQLPELAALARLNLALTDAGEPSRERKREPVLSF